MARYIWSDFEQRRAEIIARRSVIQWPEAIEVSLLLMHGRADESVDPVQTLRLALTLERAGASYGLITFEADGHVLPNNRIERDRQTLRWFDVHGEGETKHRR